MGLQDIPVPSQGHRDTGLKSRTSYQKVPNYTENVGRWEPKGWLVLGNELPRTKATGVSQSGRPDSKTDQANVQQWLALSIRTYGCRILSPFYRLETELPKDTGLVSFGLWVAKITLKATLPHLLTPTKSTLL